MSLLALLSSVEVPKVSTLRSESQPRSYITVDANSQCQGRGLHMLGYLQPTFYVVEPVYITYPDLDDWAHLGLRSNIDRLCGSFWKVLMR